MFKLFFIVSYLIIIYFIRISLRKTLKNAKTHKNGKKRDYSATFSRFTNALKRVSVRAF